MQNLEGQRVLITGGNSGLGLGIAAALVDRRASVTVVGRDAVRLDDVRRGLGVATIRGDVTDRALARSALGDVRPTVVVLNAGATPVMAPLHEQSWEDFSVAWNTDVKAGLIWIQEALRLPLARGSRVLVGSSGAAVAGSPLSGGYGGAKRMLWMMASYANASSAELDRGIRFQALVPQQIIGDTDLGRKAAEAYARRKGITTEAFLLSFGGPMPPRQYGEHVATILTDPTYADMTALGIKGDTGIRSLDG